MKDFFVAATIPILLVFVGVVLLCAWLRIGPAFGEIHFISNIPVARSLFKWLSTDPAIEFVQRLPIPENVPPIPSDDEGVEDLKGELVQLDGVPADLPGAWPRFRGASFDAISREDVVLTRSWPADGPKVLWEISVGEGYAGATVLAGRVYVLDYDRQEQADVIRCLSLANGKDIWRYSYPVKVKRNHGMSRTVPAVTEKYIVTIGPKCHVTCLDSMTGEFRWKLNLVKQFNATVPEWYTGQCPLIEQVKGADRAIIAPGGDVLMMAVDCETGEIIWQSPNPHGWSMTHSSVIPVEFAGQRMYIYCASGGVVGVSAEDGSILWENSNWKIRVANVPSPVLVGGGRIFLSGGYNAGSMMLQLVQENGKITTQEVFRLQADVFGSPQHTPILYDGYIYGVRPDGQLACLALNGQIVWTSGSAHRFGLGPYMIANGLILVMNDSGLLTLAEATPAGYKPLCEAQVLEGPESWAPMALAAGRLIVRDMNRMICLDIAEH